MASNSNQLIHTPSDHQVVHPQSKGRIIKVGNVTFEAGKSEIVTNFSEDSRWIKEGIPKNGQHEAESPWPLTWLSPSARAPASSVMSGGKVVKPIPGAIAPGVEPQKMIAAGMEPKKAKPDPENPSPKEISGVPRVYICNGNLNMSASVTATIDVKSENNLKELQRWSVGFVQNLNEMSRRAIYVEDGIEAVIHDRVQQKLPMRDKEELAPREFTDNGQTCVAEFDDDPKQFYPESLDSQIKYLMPGPKGPIPLKGKISETQGSAHFTCWLALMRKLDAKAANPKGCLVLLDQINWYQDFAVKKEGLRWSQPNPLVIESVIHHMPPIQYDDYQEPSLTCPDLRERAEGNSEIYFQLTYPGEIVVKSPSKESGADHTSTVATKQSNTDKTNINNNNSVHNTNINNNNSVHNTNVNNNNNQNNEISIIWAQGEDERDEFTKQEPISRIPNLWEPENTHATNTSLPSSPTQHHESTVARPQSSWVKGTANFGGRRGGREFHL